MNFTQPLEIVSDEPVFETGLLLAGDVEPANVRRQLSRWTRAGRLYQLRRGLYTPAPPFQKVKPHPYLIANRMVRASYVSCQSALAHCGLIPEYVTLVISLTTARPGRWTMLLGSYQFHHVKAEWLCGHRLIEVSPGQQAFVASPEKALLDLVYLTAGGDSPDYLRELRLHSLEQSDPDALKRLVALSQSPKLRRTNDVIVELARSEALEYEML